MNRRTSLGPPLLLATLVAACGEDNPSAREVVDRTAPVACAKAEECNDAALFKIAYPNGVEDCLARVKRDSESKYGDLTRPSVCTDEEVDQCLEALRSATCPVQKPTQIVLPDIPCKC